MYFLSNFHVLAYTDDEKYDEEQLRALAKPGLQKIRFLTMDISDFADGPAESVLLTKDESYAIFKKLSSFNNKHPLPDGFSPERTPRINPSKKIVNLQNKLYVQRTIKTPVLQMNNSNLTDSLNFIANDDITLLGVQVIIIFSRKYSLSRNWNRYLSTNANKILIINIALCRYQLRSGT